MNIYTLVKVLISFALIILMGFASASTTYFDAAPNLISFTENVPLSGALSKFFGQSDFKSVNSDAQKHCGDLISYIISRHSYDAGITIEVKFQGQSTGKTYIFLPVLSGTSDDPSFF